MVGSFIYSKLFGPSVQVTAAGPLWSCAEARAQSPLERLHLWSLAPVWGASSQTRGTGAAKRRHTRNILPCVLPSGAAMYTRSQNPNDSQEEEMPSRG